MWSQALDCRVDLMELDFDTLDTPTDTLVSLAEEMISSYDAPSFLSVPPSRVLTFVRTIAGLYSPTLPFHTFAHAVSVLQMTFRVCKLNLGFSSILTELERVSLFVAALGHDVGHPGVGNGFLVGTKNDLVGKYGEKSVLEKYHCAVLGEVLEREGCDLFGQLPASQAASAKQFFTACILCTDNAQHTSLVTVSSQLLSGFSKNRPADRLLAAQLLLHSADIGNQAYSATLSRKWAKRIVDEFRIQAGRELASGLPISPQCNIQTPADAHKLQSSFITSFVLPCWVTVTSFFPHTEDYIDNLRENQRLWTDGSLTVTL